MPHDVSLVRPVSVWNFPTLQRTHWDIIWMKLYEPAPHRAHVDWPVMDWKVPPTHVVQASRAAALVNCPVGHPVHWLMPALGAYRPALHPAQVL